MLQKHRGLNHLDFCDTYTGGIENPKPSYGFVSSSLSSLLSPTPSLARCGCAVERRKEGEQEQHQQELLPTPAQPGAFITDCPIYYLPLLWLESPFYPLYILGSLWTLFSSRFPRPQDRPLHLSLPSSCCSCFSGFVFLGFWVLRCPVSFRNLAKSCGEVCCFAVWGPWMRGFHRSPSCNTRRLLFILPPIPSILWGILPLKEKGACLFRYFVLEFCNSVFRDCFPYCFWSSFVLVFDPALSESFLRSTRFDAARGDFRLILKVRMWCLALINAADCDEGVICKTRDFWWSLADRFVYAVPNDGY